MARNRKKLGEILVAKGVVTQEDMDKALGIAKGSRRRVGQALVEAGFATDEQVAQALAEQYGVPYVNPNDAATSGTVQLDLIPKEIVRKHMVLPVSKDGGRLKLIVSDPMDLELQDMLRFRLNLEIDPLLASKTAIRNFLEGGENGQAGAAPKEEAKPGDKGLVTASIDRSVDRSVDKSIDIAAEDSPIVKLVNRILSEAVRMRASDVHIEPMGDRVRLRYRIDGVCVERDNLPKRMQPSLLSRVKLSAGMNIAEKRIPQDGRIKLPVDGTDIDYRVSACPTYHGESIVLRILRPDAVRIGLVNLGFEQDNLEVFNKIIRRPNGIFLVTGPTGSGKTTTLYSALDVLNRPDRKIITAEDPVEYNFDGINQCQVRDSIGLTFPAILRSMLRQAPNIILVGEIRDREVGEIAIQAALTGHLVFSTLHTNDAPSAITRLIDMGIKPFLVASSIQAVMAQRLIRMLHQPSKVPDDNPDPKHLHLCGIKPGEWEGKIYKPGNAPEAPNGYKGRKAIFEMMLMNSDLRELAFRKAPVAEIRQKAIQSGMKTLTEDGKRKILKGDTTPAEVARVTQVGEG